MLKERLTRVIASNHASIPHFLPRDHSCIYPVIVLQIDEKIETSLPVQYETRIIINLPVSWLQMMHLGFDLNE